MAQNFSRVLACCGALLCALTAACQALGNETSPDTPDRPNIILMMADDLGWGDTGYNGNPTLRTPSLDDMAKSGLVFERFYSAAPVCSPTRASVLTGRHPFRASVFFAMVGDSQKPLSLGEITLGHVLKNEGYRTGFFGKWHLGTMTKESGSGCIGVLESIEPHRRPEASCAFPTLAISMGTKVGAEAWRLRHSPKD